MASLIEGLARVTVAASTLGKTWPVPAIEEDMSHIGCSRCKEYGHYKWVFPKLHKKSKEKHAALVMGLRKIYALLLTLHLLPMTCCRVHLA